MHDQISTPSPEWWAQWRTAFVDAAEKLFEHIHKHVQGDLVVCPDEACADAMHRGIAVGLSWMGVENKTIRDCGHMDDSDVVAEVRVKVVNGQSPTARFVVVDDRHLEIHVQLPPGEKTASTAYLHALKLFTHDVCAELSTKVGAEVAYH